MNISKKAITRLLSSASAAATMSAAAADLPVVSGVTISQDASTRLVTVGYTLSGTNAIVTVDFLTNGVSIGGANIHHVVGDVNTVVEPGQRSIYWQPRRSWPGQTVANALTARVTAWSESSPPDYLVADLANGSLAYYETADFLPDGGLTNDIYRTERIVMRRIHASGETYWEGSPTTESGRSSNETRRQVSFTNDFYLGVFELTMGQMSQVDSKWASDNGRALDRSKWVNPASPVFLAAQDGYNGLCHSTTTYPSSHAVESGSQLDLMRQRFGGKCQLDIPTSAQWEFACRAGTTTAFYWGDDASVFGDYGWYKGNANSSAHRVGEKLPNAWGLYDMLGNVLEATQDRWVSSRSSDAVIDPVTSASTSDTEKRGGHWVEANTSSCRCATRIQYGNKAYGGAQGVRLSIPIK